MTGLRNRILQLHAAGIADVEIAARMMVRLQIVRKLLPRDKAEPTTEAPRHREEEPPAEGRQAHLTPALSPLKGGEGAPVETSVPRCLCGSPSLEPIRTVPVAAPVKPRTADDDLIAAFITAKGVTRVPMGVSALPLTMTREERQAMGWRILASKRRMAAAKRKRDIPEDAA